MDNKDFYQQRMAGGAVFHGGVMMQGKGEIGGTKHVFVMTTRAVRNGFDYPPIGGRIANPFPGRAKVFAGDVCEYTDTVADNVNGATIKILKTYEVAVATAEATDTVIYITRDGYKHIPFVGDKIMVGAAKFTTKGKGVSVTAVEKTTKDDKDVWALTLSETLGALTAGKVLVEAAEVGPSVLPVVTNPNAYFASDEDFAFSARQELNDYSGAAYFITPALASDDVYLYKHKMSPIPPALEAANTSRYAGWFAL